MKRTKLTQTAILARAISDCTTAIRDNEARMDAFAKAGKSVEATFFYDNIIRPLQEERDTLCLLYEIETGAPYGTDD